MHHIDTHYIDGAFTASLAEATAPLFNPATEAQIGTVRLGGAADIDAAVAAAKRAAPALAASSVAERVDLLRRLHAAVAAEPEALVAAMDEEYGAPAFFTRFITPLSAQAFEDMAGVLEAYPFRRSIGRAEVEMRPLGVAAAIIPWNGAYHFMASKLAAAIAASSPLVIKPSELSGLQVQRFAERLHAAALPPGVVNVVHGDGATAGAALARHPDIAKISFTGSTATGRAIHAAAGETMKRVTLELGGKSPSIILDDADLDMAAPQALMAGFGNSGQACIAGTRILAPRSRYEDVVARLSAIAGMIRVGGPDDASAQIGPLVSARQWDRVQGYIRLGIEEGARLVAGGEGRPEHLERGWFARPTVFADVNNGMRIAREEIFGPVLCVIPYDDEAEAVRIANDTPYGLQAYVFSGDVDRARRVASRIDAGRVVINGAPHEPLAPFGGFKQSGIGRESGVFGLEAYLEPRAVLA